MATVLKVNSSVLPTGNSNRLTDEFVARWLERRPADRLVVRDLTHNPIPHLNAQTVSAFFISADQRTVEQQQAIALSDESVAELKTADVIILGVPTYNLGIPSPLKAWIDHVARAGITFKYSEEGPLGLLHDKKVYVFAARGGQSEGTERDTQSQYLKNILGLMGLTDIEFVYAEGLNISPEQKMNAEKEAHERIQSLTALQAA